MIATLADLASVVTRWRTWKLMGDQDIAMRYRRSVIGPFWISLSMGAMLLGMALLFSGLFEHNFREYLVYLGVGFLVWNLLISMVTEGCTVTIDAEGQLRSVAIPLPVLAARMVYRNFVIFLHNALVIGIEFVLLGAPLSIGALGALPGLVVILLVGFLASLTLGPLCLRFRDVTQVVGSLFQFLFFLTPIMWMPDQGRVPQIVVQANPIYHLIEIVRAPLEGRVANELSWWVAGGVLASLAIMGFATLALTRKRVFLWL